MNLIRNGRIEEEGQLRVYSMKETLLKILGESFLGVVGYTNRREGC